MNRFNFKAFNLKTIVTSGVAAVVLLSTVAFAALNGNTAQSALAQTSAATPVKTITVIGDGKVKIKPDIARANIGVEVLRPSVEEASAANKKLIESVIKTLVDAGIAKEDIQTSGFSVYAERFGQDGPLPDDKVNYRVSNNVQVTIRDLDKVGEVLDAAMKSGANNIYGIEFSLEDNTSAKSEARKDAVADAKAKAEELAELTGVKVGKVLSISEVIGGAPPYYSNLQTTNAFGGGGGQPIQPGELEIGTQLQITYEIVE